MAEKKSEQASFENMLDRVEEIVAKMDGGGLTLEESMALYEEGIRDIGLLTGMLNDVRDRVTKLVEDTKGGQSLEPFEQGETS